MGFGEAMVGDWQTAGLVKPSVLKPVFSTIEKGLALRMMGTLTDTDQNTLREILAKVLG